MISRAQILEGSSILHACFFGHKTSTVRISRLFLYLLFLRADTIHFPDTIAIDDQNANHTREIARGILRQDVVLMIANNGF